MIARQEIVEGCARKQVDGKALCSDLTCQKESVEDGHKTKILVRILRGAPRLPFMRTVNAGAMTILNQADNRGGTSQISKVVGIQPVDSGLLPTEAAMVYLLVRKRQEVESKLEIYF